MKEILVLLLVAILNINCKKNEPCTPDAVVTLLTGSTNFITPTTSRNLIVNLWELGGCDATYGKVLITKIAGLNITIPSITQMTIGGNIYNLDNSNWTISDYAPLPNLYYELSCNNVFLLANTNKKIGLELQRTTTNIGTFSVTCIVGGIEFEANTSNNTSIKKFTFN